MTLLFFSAVCDFCEGKVKTPYHRGFTVYRGGCDGQIHDEYVFRTRDDAEKWRALMNLTAYQVREVYSEQPFCWRRSNGTVRDLELADRLYAIFPNRCYEPSPSRAHIADS